MNNVYHTIEAQIQVIAEDLVYYISSSTYFEIKSIRINVLDATSPSIITCNSLAANEFFGYDYW